ncbi:tobH protein [Rhodococcus spongiicola]|uniref:TobH protein n=1 Tax=Rhodococcus spongiicola TaxID=2487352 RepID=A0A3S3E3F5_9NOCA|nr:tobH protein [Rhodococcus spongiicola]RVW04977.1 tobH protein [Rhodococcus spongiicola]
MTAPSSLLDLDDVDALLAADVDGSLRFAALGGAQIRATQATVEEDGLARLHGLQPRSVVLVTGDGCASRAAELLTAAVGSRIGIPLVESVGTPKWVGPLDVVVVAGDDAGDPRLVESVDHALGRGAEVVIAAPEEGPLRAAGAGRATTLPPRVAVPDHHGLLRYVAVFLAVLIAIESERVAAVCPDLGRLADAVDDEALRDHPRNEVFHNPAKSLAARIRRRRVVLSGDTRATTHLARHGAEVLLRTGGAVAAAADLSEVLAAGPLFDATGSMPAGEDSLFHDEQIDGPMPGMPLRVFVFASEANRPAIERRVAALRDADVVVAASDQAGPLGPPGSPTETTAVARAEIEQIAVLVSRLEMSAAYLHLIGGS